MGLPFAFASHFAPEHMEQAITIYRERFQPSEQLNTPYVMLTANVFAADTDAEAERLATSMQVQFVNLVRGTPGQVQAPIDDMEAYWKPEEKAWVQRALSRSFIGSEAKVEATLVPKCFQAR